MYIYRHFAGMIVSTHTSSDVIDFDIFSQFPNRLNSARSTSGATRFVDVMSPAPASRSTPDSSDVTRGT